MANQAMNDAWEPLLERYLAHAARRYKALGKPIKIPGATPGQLAFLHSQSQRYGLVIDPSIERLLARVNGAGYDGVFLYGIQIPEHGDLYGRIDMVYMNRLIEEGGAGYALRAMDRRVSRAGIGHRHLRAAQHRRLGSVCGI